MANLGCGFIWKVHSKHQSLGIYYSLAPRLNFWDKIYFLRASIEANQNNNKNKKEQATVNNFNLQAPVFQTMDGVLHWIKHYPEDIYLELILLSS